MQTGNRTQPSQKPHVWSRDSYSYTRKDYHKKSAGSEYTLFQFHRCASGNQNLISTPRDTYSKLRIKILQLLQNNSLVWYNFLASQPGCVLWLVHVCKLFKTIWLWTIYLSTRMMNWNLLHTKATIPLKTWKFVKTVDDTAMNCHTRQWQMSLFNWVANWLDGWITCIFLIPLFPMSHYIRPTCR